MSIKLNNKCWVCDSEDLVLIKKSDIDSSIDSTNFAITNSDYGKTGELSQCKDCGFIQCTGENDVISYYEDLVDTEYENTREERKLQEKRILQLIKKMKPAGTLLDIGAGSGITVELAIEMAYKAEGIEPSRWLQEQAAKRGLPVHQGTFPMNGIRARYDVITLVDVIEHVNKPKVLLKEIYQYLEDDGIFVMITPDVSSFMAKLFKWKWWHFRVAHIGYFNKRTLARITESAGFKCIKRKRAVWYFSVGYLLKRSYSYLPRFLHIPLPAFMKKLVIPVNLRDSWLAVYKKS